VPYTIRKQKCKRSDDTSGSYVLSYTDKHGKKHRNCHKSRKSARGQIAAIEGPKESIDHFVDVILEKILNRLIEN
jgi:hypothetical protein